MALRIAALFAIGLIGGVQAAAAQTGCPVAETGANDGEMAFTVRERPGQPPVLIADGVIDQNVVPRLQAALDSFEGTEVWLRSPGGFAGVDHRAGFLIRQRGLTTRVPAGWACRGACVFMFLGGQTRIVDPGGALIVDMFEHTGALPNTTEIERSSRMLATQDNDFLIRMGISRRLLTEVMYRQTTPASTSTGRCLTSAELTEYRITPTPVVRRPR